MTPESTAKTHDSGIGSLANRLQEEQQLESSLGSSPEPPSTGNEQADTALLWHVLYCDRLLEVSGERTPTNAVESHNKEFWKWSDICRHM